MTSTDITEGEGGPAAAISVSAPKLRRMLSAVLPHAADDDTLPALNAVRFEVAAGVLYLAATDRYTIGVARTEIPGAAAVPVPDSGFLLPLEAGWALRRLLKGADGVAALAFGDGRLTVDCEHGTAGWAAVAMGEFPDWRGLLYPMITAPSCELGDSSALDPQFLRRFTIGKSAWHDLLTVRIAGRPVAETGRVSPVVVVTYGDWFIGAQVPARVVSTASPASAALAIWTAVTAPEPKTEAA